jgi:hypothetical protein
MVGCAGQSAPSGTDDRHSSAAGPASTEPSAATPSTPRPFVDLGCADIFNAAEVDAALRTSVPLLPAVQWKELGSNVGPTSFAVRQSGGLECEWSNGLSDVIGTARAGDYVGIVVRVLPSAAEPWSRYTDYYAVDGTENLGCDTVDRSVQCWIDSLFGDTWAQVGVWGLDVRGGETAQVAAIRGMADTVRRSVEAADGNTRTWAPPSDTVPLANRCDEFFSSTDVTSVLGLTGDLVLSAMDGGVSLIGSAWSEASARPCPWAMADGTPIDGGLRMLPGGEWAWKLTHTGADLADYRQVAIPGLEPQDSAFTRCSPAGACTIEIVVGHNWVQIYLNRGADHVDATRAALLTLADKTVSSVRT